MALKPSLGSRLRVSPGRMAVTLKIARSLGLTIVAVLNVVVVAFLAIVAVAPSTAETRTVVPRVPVKFTKQ